MKENPKELAQLWEAAGSLDPAVSAEPSRKLATALQPVLRKGVLPGDNIAGIFETQDYRDCRSVEYPLDFISPGTENDYVAYTINECAGVPHRHVQGAQITVPTYTVANSIEWCLKYQRCANWNVAARAMEVLRNGFVKKLNDDGWHVLLAAGLDRNIVVYDDAAAPGQFTKRLVSLMRLSMRRNGGGNSTSLNRGALTDLYVSPEGLEDMHGWTFNDLDDVTRRQVFMSPDGLSNVFGINLHSLDELGVNSQYQTYYLTDLGGSLPPTKLELVVGLDKRNNDSFVSPIVQDLVIHDDPTLLRQMRAGWFSWMELGMAVLNNQRVLLGAF